jgi:2-polyprenyl-3-methyl-5-hydroxy-6-metoxy-1,4-benzoquinol methylase
VIYRWSKTGPLDRAPARRFSESWTRTAPDGSTVTHDMQITIGKPFDVLALKGTDLEEWRSYARFLHETAGRLYADGALRQIIAHCPCCNHGTGDASKVLTVFSIDYHQCVSCGHVFVREQPRRADLETNFQESAEHSATYTDRAAAERRVAAIAVPKLAWAQEHYRRLYDREPTAGLDIGAGGGHFVAAMQRAGLDAAGYELSAASRHFAKEAFDITLRAGDFAAATPSPVELLTLWGVLEYVPDPQRLLKAARQHISPQSGLLIVEVPRFTAIGTRAQGADGAIVARHMDPTSHVNAFTDSSLAEALALSGFAPVAAWYFGMDAYEMLCQIALRRNDASLIDEMADLIPLLQEGFDHGRQCDDLVIAARPM